MYLISSFRTKKDAIKICKFHTRPQSFLFTTTSDFEYSTRKHALSSNECGVILQSLTKSKSLKMGQTLHGYLVSSGLIQDNTYLYTNIAAFYASCGCMNAARIIFDQIVDKSRFLWNFMIRGYASNGYSMEAISLYHTMMRFGVLSDNFTYPFVIKACGDLVHVYFGRIVHAHAVVNGFHFDVYVANCLLAMYVRFGDLENARKVFDVMPNRDLTSCNTIIAGYAKHGDTEALHIFKDLLVTGPGLDSTKDSMKFESVSWQGGGGGHPGLGLNVVRNNKDYDETNLFIGNLPRTLEDEGLITIFSGFGEIVWANVVKDRETNMCKGYGFVKYANVDQANAAIVWMNQRLIKGRKLMVTIAGRPLQPAPPQPEANPPAPYSPPNQGLYSYSSPRLPPAVSIAPRTHPSDISSSYAYSPYYGAPPPAEQPQVRVNVARSGNPPLPPLAEAEYRKLMSDRVVKCRS